VADDLPERERLAVDVVIVGAGPAGLAAAIRLKQLAPQLAVAVLEKGSEVGAHILSGAVIDPIGIDALLPAWREEESPLQTPVTAERFLWLGAGGSIRVPNVLLPPVMRNHGAYVASLGEVCRWLATKAEALGVDIFPGFAAVETLHDQGGAVIGVATGDKGVARDGSRKLTFQRGIAIDAKYTLIGEGARGSLAKGLIARFGLADGRAPQKYGIGLKELWEVAPEMHAQAGPAHRRLAARQSYRRRLFPLPPRRQSRVDRLRRSPQLRQSASVAFRRIQRFKTHPAIAPLLVGGKRVAYGARAITEGGWQSVPRLTFPGGALIGCAAGFVNVPRIKGSHNAILSGMLAAEHVAAAIEAGRAHDEVVEYDDAWRTSPIGRDLKRVRNAKPLWSKLGTVAGLATAGVDLWTNTVGLSLFGTLGHGKPTTWHCFPRRARGVGLRSSRMA
jgi:electron-transferring-flavoprotein dehydrogenase